MKFKRMFFLIAVFALFSCRFSVPENDIYSVTVVDKFPAWLQAAPSGRCSADTDSELVSSVVDFIYGEKSERVLARLANGQETTLSFQVGIQWFCAKDKSIEFAMSDAGNPGAELTKMRLNFGAAHKMVEGGSRNEHSPPKVKIPQPNSQVFEFDCESAFDWNEIFELSAMYEDLSPIDGEIFPMHVKFTRKDESIELEMTRNDNGKSFQIEFPVLEEHMEEWKRL